MDAAWARGITQSHCATRVLAPLAAVALASGGLACSDSPSAGGATPSAPGQTPGAGVSLDSSPALSIVWHASIPAAQAGGLVNPRIGADPRTLYAAVAGAVTAYDLATGAVRWHAPGLAGVPSALTSDGATVLYAADVLAALDAQSGAVRWRTTLPASAGQAAPVQDAARVYVGTAAAGGGATPAVFAYDRVTGAPLWAAPVGAGWSYRSGVRGLTLVDGVLYIAASQCTIAQCATVVSWVIALDPATGAERWRLRAGDPADPTRAVLLVRPVVAAGGLLLASDNRGNAALAINPVQRKVIWRTAFRTGYGGPSDAPVDDSSGTVYVGSGDTYVYALDRATGARRWETSIGGSIFALGRCGRAVVAQAVGLYAVRRSDGRLLATAYGREDEVPISPVVNVGDRIVVGTTSGVAVLQCP